MNRQQLIKLAQREIDNRRFDAEAKCDAQLAFLRKDPSYKACESDLRRAQLAGDQTKITLYRERLAQILEAYDLTEKDVKPQYHSPIFAPYR